MKMSKHALPVLVCLVLAITARAGQKEKVRTKLTPQEFVAQAIECSTAEIQLAEMAKKQSSNQSVRDFAAKLINDHQKCRKELVNDAKALKVAVVIGLSKEYRNAKEKLAEADGARFDQQYLTGVVERHQKALKILDAQSEKSTNADVRNFASRSLPTMREHLQRARQLLNQLKKQ